jgi:hypothetical protein
MNIQPAVPSTFREPSGKRKIDFRWPAIAVALVLFGASVAFSQSAPKVSGVDPNSGKVNDSVTVSGSNLTKDAVSGVFLSDDKTDYKATIVQQSADKIVMKVPQVKPGSYNISIQVGTGILIEPVRITIQQ